MADLLLVLGALLLAGALDPAAHESVRAWLERRREDRRALPARRLLALPGPSPIRPYQASRSVNPRTVRPPAGGSAVRSQGWGPAEGESVHGFNVRQRQAAELQGDPPPPPYPRDQHGG